MTLEEPFLPEDPLTFPNLKDAKQSCLEQGALCAGVVRNKKNGVCSLHKNGIPRNRENTVENLIRERNGKLPSGPLGNAIRQAQLQYKEKIADGEYAANKTLFDNADVSHGLSNREFKHYLFPYHQLDGQTVTYLKSCHAPYGSYQGLPKPLQVTVDKNVSSWVDDHLVERYHVHAFSFRIDLQVLVCWLSGT